MNHGAGRGWRKIDSPAPALKNPRLPGGDFFVRAASDVEEFFRLG